MVAARRQCVHEEQTGVRNGMQVKCVRVVREGRKCHKEEEGLEDEAHRSQIQQVER